MAQKKRFHFIVCNECMAKLLMAWPERDEANHSPTPFRSHVLKQCSLEEVFQTRSLMQEGWQICQYLACEKSISLETTSKTYHSAKTVELIELNTIL